MLWNENAIDRLKTFSSKSPEKCPEDGLTQQSIIKKKNILLCFTAYSQILRVIILLLGKVILHSNKVGSKGKKLAPPQEPQGNVDTATHTASPLTTVFPGWVGK